MKSRYYTNLLLLLLLGQLLIPLVNWHAVLQKNPHLHPRLLNAAPIDNTPILSDLDGDNKLDITELIAFGHSKRVHIRFSNKSTIELNFNTEMVLPGSLIVTDIDQDNDLDIIWLPKARPNLAHIWYGNGHGSFTSNDSSLTSPAHLKFLTNLTKTDKDGFSSRMVGCDPRLLQAKRQLLGLSAEKTTLALPPAILVTHQVSSISKANSDSFACSDNRAPPTIA